MNKEMPTFTTPEGKDYPRYFDNCTECERYKARGNPFFPQHSPSKYCESGFHAHCTCSWCW